MSRPLRLELAGALYHITSRGDGQEPIYLDDRDRTVFLAILAHTCERYGWICHSYCLMTNHYHLLVVTRTANLARGMRHLNGVYTKRLNCAHRRVGHVYQGRYSSILVQKERHLLELIRYIVLNPVRAGMVPVADQWPWNSYQATAGLVASPTWLSTEGTTAIFGGGAEGRQGFMQFVRDGIGAPSCWRHLKNQIYLGDSAFVSHAQDRVAAEAPGLSEVPITQRCSHPAPMARWAPRCPEDPSLRDLTERNQAIIDSFASGHATMRAIGEHFGIHYSRVSRIVGAAERARGKA
jgi:putative transposase